MACSACSETILGTAFGRRRASRSRIASFEPRIAIILASLSHHFAPPPRHSVYSFFLVNVKATLEHGVLYPAKAIWEDIEVQPNCRILAAVII